MLTIRGRKALVTAASMAQAAALDPSQAASAASELARQIAIVKNDDDARIEATRILSFSLPQLAVSPSQTGFQLLTFKENYHVIGVLVSEAGGVTNLGQLALNLQDDAQLSVFLNNQGQPGTVDFWALASVGGGLQKIGSYFPLDRYVLTNKTWQANIINANLAAVTNPQVYLLVEPWDPQADPVPPKSGAY